jgi:hypothetical protein
MEFTALEDNPSLVPILLNRISIDWEKDLTGNWIRTKANRNPKITQLYNLMIL